MGRQPHLVIINPQGIIGVQLISTYHQLRKKGLRELITINSAPSDKLGHRQAQTIIVSLLELTSGCLIKLVYLVVLKTMEEVMIKSPCILVTNWKQIPQITSQALISIILRCHLRDFTVSAKRSEEALGSQLLACGSLRASQEGRLESLYGPPTISTVRRDPEVDLLGHSPIVLSPTCRKEVQKLNFNNSKYHLDPCHQQQPPQVTINN